jgi:16S rRNA C1402 (ribose-2'-O) methylase RsmI
VKKGSESLSNEKTKNSLSERRVSIVKSIDKLASSIVLTDEANSAAAVSSSSMMPMFLVIQMQQQAQQQTQQQSQQQQLQQQLQFQQALMQRDFESQIKGVEAQVRDQREAMMKVLHSL